MGVGNQENVYGLSTEEVVIGRKSNSNIVLSNPYISRHHAKIGKREGGHLLMDLSSKHGTWVNGQRISRHELKHGDRITLGQDQVELRYLAEAIATARPEDTTVQSEIEELETSFRHLTQLLPDPSSQHSDLEKISYLLDFQYSWEKNFSPQKAFRQSLAAALEISGAERGFILLKEQTAFEYTVGMRNRPPIIS